MLRLDNLSCTKLSLAYRILKLSDTYPFTSMDIRRTMFLNFIKISVLLTLRLRNCERIDRVEAFLRVGSYEKKIHYDKLYDEVKFHGFKLLET